MASRNPRTAWSGYRQVRIGPRFSKFRPVPGFEIFHGSGPVWSQVLKLSYVLVRASPGFLKFSRSWSEPVFVCGFLMASTKSKSYHYFKYIYDDMVNIANTSYLSEKSVFA